MIIGRTLCVTNRKAWRAWLRKNHSTAKEIWLIYHKKGSGKKRIPYNDAVEEALCYGWIDSTVKSLDTEKFTQRFTPRRPKSELSELNKERVRRLIKSRKMTKAGLDKIARHLSSLTGTRTNFVCPKDILDKIKQHPEAWKNYRRFPLFYRRIRIGWIDASRIRPEMFGKRLKYFLSMTERNKKFGMIQ